MGVANEVLDYLRILVWPGVVVGIVVVFRRQFGVLLGRLTDVNTPWGSAKFGQKVAELAERAEEVRGELGPVGAAVAVNERAFAALRAPEVSEPTLAFLEAYRELEVAAQFAAETVGLRRSLPVPVARHLVDRGIAPPSIGGIAEDLRSIRNEVVHGNRRLQQTDARNLVLATRSLGDVLVAGAEHAKAKEVPREYPDGSGGPP